MQIDKMCNDIISMYLVNEEEYFEDIIIGLQKLNELLQKIEI
jgi:hypothetical protein